MTGKRTRYIEFMKKKRKSKNKIFKRLQISYFIMCVLIIVVGVVGIFYLREVYRNSNEIYEKNITSITILRSMSQNVRDIDLNMSYLVNMGDDIDKKKNSHIYLNKIDSLIDENEEMKKEYSEIDAGSMEKRRFKQCVISFKMMIRHIDTVKEEVRKGDYALAKATYEQEFSPAKATAYELLDALVELASKNAEERNESNKNIYHNMQFFIGFTISVSMILAFIVSITTSRYIKKRLNSIQTVAHSLAEYDLQDDEDRVRYDDEFGQTLEALSDSQSVLKEMIRKTERDIGEIKSNSNEITGAVKNTLDKIQEINVKVIDAEKLLETNDHKLRKLINDKSVDEKNTRELLQILSDLGADRVELKKLEKDLVIIIRFVEQIIVTSDEQDEIVENYMSDLIDVK